MSSTSLRRAVRLLLRGASLVVVVLAVVAGLVGMHALSAGPSTPIQQAAAGSQPPAMPMTTITPTSSAAMNESGVHPNRAHGSAAKMGRTPIERVASGGAGAGGCLLGCPSSMDMSDACIPYPSSSIPFAPAPDTGVVSVLGPMHHSAGGPNYYSHFPDSPSLNQLSISRT
ncbi:DUF6153 family protein [Paenarthrobacter sp. Z7-10]|uniref:DUF6153 family protein n=1 Tax=Paenarthrobacter sp. Z7-10 TaxID=2787635 RepID=UPI003FA7953A